MDEDNFAQELQKQLIFWQEALFLRDWTVELRIVRQWDMSDTGTLAQCEWYLQRRDAIIKVWRAETSTPPTVIEKPHGKHGYL